MNLIRRGDMVERRRNGSAEIPEEDRPGYEHSVMSARLWKIIFVILPLLFGALGWAGSELYRGIDERVHRAELLSAEVREIAARQALMLTQMARVLHKIDSHADTSAVIRDHDGRIERLESRTDRAEARLNTLEDL